MSGSDTLSWCTIESDPGVFTHLLRDIGVRGVEVQEIYSLDDPHMKARHVLGLVMLFKYNEKDYSQPSGRRKSSSLSSEGQSDRAEGDSSSKIFFAKQMIPNACATQAILSVVLNATEPSSDPSNDPKNATLACSRSLPAVTSSSATESVTSSDKQGIAASFSVDIGPTLRGLKSFCETFSPELKGITIGNCPALQQAHNAFARPQLLTTSRASYGTTKVEDAFHFTAYVPVENTVFELDGLRDAPIVVCKLKHGEDWLQTTVKAIRARMQGDGDGKTIYYNLMAIRRDRVDLLQEKAVHLKQEVAKSATSCSNAENGSSTAGPLRAESEKDCLSTDTPEHSATDICSTTDRADPVQTKRGACTSSYSALSTVQLGQVDAPGFSTEQEQAGHKVHQPNLDAIVGRLDQDIGNDDPRPSSSSDGGATLSQSSALEKPEAVTTPSVEQIGDPGDQGRPESTQPPSAEERLKAVQVELQELHEERKRAVAENTRKQHDYTPFVVAFFKILNKRKQLVSRVKTLASGGSLDKERKKRPRKE